MPISIIAAQKESVDSGFLDTIGEDKDTFQVTTGVFEQYGGEFLKNMGKYANERKVVASGKILSEATFKMSDDGSVMQIIMPDYFDYPNEGVKGWGSSKNAPKSPYQYKSKGMSPEGLASIKQYIQSGHAKIATVVKTKDKALGIGREKKHLSLIDTQTNTLAYMIKRQGIKATNYFTDALNETFKDFEVKMSEALGSDIIFTLEKLNR
jgi:hypothetical protein